VIKLQGRRVLHVEDLELPVNSVVDAVIDKT